VGKKDRKGRRKKNIEYRTRNVECRRERKKRKKNEEKKKKKGPGLFGFKD
jgi:hypothetical protein